MQGITEEQYDQNVKATIVSMLAMGASIETIVDYLYDVKPDICKQIAQNPAAVITAFFKADPVLVHATEMKDWDDILADAKEYIAEVEAEKKNEPPAIN